MVSSVVRALCASRDHHVGCIRLGSGRIRHGHIVVLQQLVGRVQSASMLHRICHSEIRHGAVLARIDGDSDEGSTVNLLSLSFISTVCAPSSILLPQHCTHKCYSGGHELLLRLSRMDRRQRFSRLCFSVSKKSIMAIASPLPCCNP
jgi:hypothetical protein